MSNRSVHEGNVLPEDGEKHGPAAWATEAFCEVLAGDLGISASAARTAFIGEDTERVLGVASWAMDRSDSPEERTRMCIAWAKKRRAGAFRAPEEEYVSLAGHVGGTDGGDPHYREMEALAKLLALYWADNPRRLARVLDEAEIWFDAEVKGGA